MYKWLEAYSVGVPLFDAQHKALFELVNALFARLQVPSEDEEAAEVIAQLVHELVRYTQYHFTQEEKMMRLYHYPELEAHLKEHHELVAFLDAFDSDSLLQDPYGAGSQLLGRMVSWITHHIQVVDKRYSQFLNDSLNPSRR